MGPKPKKIMVIALFHPPPLNAIVAIVAIMETPADSAVPGTLDELVNLLEEIDDPHTLSSQLQGRPFSMSMGEYLTFRDMERPEGLPRFDYANGFLLFKSESIVHAMPVACLGVEIARGVHGWQAALGPIVGFPFHLSVPVTDSLGAPTFILKPDVGLGFPDLDSGAIYAVVEVSYAHRLPRAELERRYQLHFQDHQGRVKVVICFDIYYGRGQDRLKQTAEHLDRSAISMWIMDKDGNIRTTMD